MSTEEERARSIQEAHDHNRDIAAKEHLQYSSCRSCSSTSDDDVEKVVGRTIATS